MKNRIEDISWEQRWAASLEDCSKIQFVSLLTVTVDLSELKRQFLQVFQLYFHIYSFVKDKKKRVQIPRGDTDVLETYSCYICWDIRDSISMQVLYE